VLPRLLPDRHVLRAVARERLALPAGPAFAERHAGEPRHQVELGRPDVPERNRQDVEPAVDDAVMVGDEALPRDVVLVEAEPRRTHGEREEGLAGPEPLELR